VKFLSGVLDGSITLGDMNANGKIDAIVASAVGSVAIPSGKGDGTFSKAVLYGLEAKSKRFERFVRPWKASLRFLHFYFKHGGEFRIHLHNACTSSSCAVDEEGHLHRLELYVDKLK
jgi:hypothetical protein